MTIERLYKRAEHADEVCDLDLKDASQNEIIETTYHAWVETVKDREFYDSKNFYDIACRLVRPFKGRVRGELRVSELPFLEQEDNVERDKLSAGLYLSALLNETELDTLITGRPFRFWGIGYYIREGKRVEVENDRDKSENSAILVGELGSFARGGVVINRGSTVQTMGDNAQGGVHINLGRLRTKMGGSTSSGIYLNYGFVDWNIGEAAKGGIFLNFDKLERTWRMEPGEPEGAEIGERACGGVFVTKYLPERGFMLQANGAYGVGPEELASDKRLASLLDEIEHIGKILNIPKTKELAHRIDAHVRVNYRPRKIA